MKTKLWCCAYTIKNEERSDFRSLAKTRHESIGICSDSAYDWKIMKNNKWKWKCIKVEVIINPINEVK